MHIPPAKSGKVAEAWTGQSALSLLSESLSGERKRPVAIAGVLAMRRGTLPSIIRLFTDPAAADRVTEIIDKLPEGAVIIHITHNMAQAAALSERVS